MNPLYILIILFTFVSCSEQKVEQSQTTSTIKETIIESKKTTNDAFQKIIDSAELNGVILIYDPQEDEYISNDFKRSEQGFLPASTFKIPNSIILLETGVVDENTLFKWDGKKRHFKMWERDFNFHEAYQKSCLPCYQEVTPKVGVDKMKDFLKKFDYGKMEVDSTSMDSFWILGNSKISAKGQIDFLHKFYNSQLPISLKTEKIMRKIMVIDENNTYKLSGKTGWMNNGDENLGWFVGFMEKGEKVYFIATNVDPKENFDMKDFLKIRLEISLKAMKKII